MQKTSLYRHFDRSGRLLYVGISVRHLDRLAKHKSSAHWYWDISKISVTHYPNRAAAERAERRAIRVECPLHNVARPPAKPIRSDVIDALLSADQTQRERAARRVFGPRRMAYLRLTDADDPQMIGVELSTLGVPEGLVFVDDAESEEMPMLLRALKFSQHQGTVIYCQRKAYFWSSRRILRRRGVTLSVMHNNPDTLAMVASEQNATSVRKSRGQS